MTPLTKALLSKCEFEVDTICSRPAKWLKYNAGAKNENARLMPLIRALADVVDGATDDTPNWDTLDKAIERLKGLVGG